MPHNQSLTTQHGAAELSLTSLKFETNNETVVDMDRFMH
jgi:hypothetical protein